MALSRPSGNGGIANHEGPRARAFLRRSGVQRAINALTGVAMIGLGIRLAAESA